MLTPDELATVVCQMSDLLVAVATGGPRINEVNGEYCQLRDLLSNELSTRGLAIKFLLQIFGSGMVGLVGVTFLRGD